MAKFKVTLTGVRELDRKLHALASTKEGNRSARSIARRGTRAAAKSVLGPARRALRRHYDEDSQDKHWADTPKVRAMPRSRRRVGHSVVTVFSGPIQGVIEWGFLARNGRKVEGKWPLFHTAIQYGQRAIQAFRGTVAREIKRIF